MVTGTDGRDAVIIGGGHNGLRLRLCQRHFESDPPWRRIGNLALTHLGFHLRLFSWLPWLQTLFVAGQ